MEKSTEDISSREIVCGCENPGPGGSRSLLCPESRRHTTAQRETEGKGRQDELLSPETEMTFWGSWKNH